MNSINNKYIDAQRTHIYIFYILVFLGIDWNAESIGSAGQEKIKWTNSDQ